MPGFKDHFSANADLYASARPHYPPSLAAWLAQHCVATDCALDAGCGNGQLALDLARHFNWVVATDASAAQIAAATPHPRVEYRCAPAERSGLPAMSVDLVTVAQAAHWFDLPSFYAEVERIARPGALLALISYGQMELPGEAGAPMVDFYANRIAAYWPPERRHILNGLRELPFPYPELEQPELAIEERWTLEQVLAYIGTWSALAKVRAAGKEAMLDEFAEALGRAWGDPATRLTARWPLRMRLGRIAVSRGSL